MKPTYVIVALSLSLAGTVEAQAASSPVPGVVTNLPADGSLRHTIYALAIPPQEPSREPVSLAPTNGPTPTDLGVGASSLVRQEITLLDDGAVGDYGLQKVYFPADITEAPVTIITPDGRKLACRATFLSFYDMASGQSLLLGEVKDTIGELVGDNTVVYPNAFDTISADVRYRYAKYSLEQDIILHEGVKLPPPPDARESQTIVLRPPSENGAVPPTVAVDEHLKFGAMRIGDGYAFGIQSESKKTAVAKTFSRIDGRDWLIERVDYRVLKPELDKLPKPQASVSPEKLNSDRTRLVRSLHARTDSKPSGKTMRLAQAKPPNQNSLVLDFTIVSSVPAPAGIISWWPAGKTYDVIGTNDVSLSNGATNSAGKVGQGFSLDGVNDRITAPDSELPAKLIRLASPHRRTSSRGGRAMETPTIWPAPTLPR